MVKKFYIRSNEILFYLFPISIVFSNFLANFIVFYLAIYGLIILFINENSYIKNKVIYILLLFWLYISIRSFFSSEIFYSLKSSILLIRYFLFFIAVSYMLEKDKRAIKYLTTLLSIFFVILFIDSFYEFYSGKNIFGFQEGVKFRISSFFEGRFVLGSYVSKIVLLLIILLGHFFSQQTFKFIFVVISIFSLIIILLSGDRAAFGLFLISLLILIFLSNNDFFNLKKKIVYFVSIFIVLISAFLFSDNFKKRFYYQTLSDIRSADKIYYFSKGHQSHWQTSLEMFKDNKLFGKGPNMFRKLCDDPKYNSGPKSCSTHPHNYYIQLLGETGIIGFLLILFVYFLIILKLLKQFFYVYVKKTNYLNFKQLTIISLTFGNFWPLITTGNIFGSFNLNLIIFPLCFYYFLRSEK